MKDVHWEELQDEILEDDGETYYTITPKGYELIQAWNAFERDYVSGYKTFTMSDMWNAFYTAFDAGWVGCQTETMNGADTTSIEGSENSKRTDIS